MSTASCLRLARARKVASKKVHPSNQTDIEAPTATTPATAQNTATANIEFANAAGSNSLPEKISGARTNAFFVHCAGRIKAIRSRRKTTSLTRRRANLGHPRPDFLHPLPLVRRRRNYGGGRKLRPQRSNASGQRTAFQLVTFRQCPCSAQAVLIEEIGQVEFFLLRTAANIDENQYAGQALAPSQIVLDQAFPLGTLGFGAFRPAVTRQIHKRRAIVDVVENQPPRTSRSLARTRELFATRQRVDERRLPDV